jgi:hypothetical protein
MALLGFKLLRAFFIIETKHVSPATLLHDSLYATGKTPTKLVQVVQELHATVDIYFPARKTTWN